MATEQGAYAPSTSQLVVEVFARDIEASKRFYQQLGFDMVEDRGTFVTLSWEGHHFYLDERPDQPPVPSQPQANMRIKVPDVDRYWQLARELEAPVVAPIEDREYGLRDFTILDPDGFGLRFGTWLDR
ncbi:MAG: VOC family protein [Thermomicrobiales bacterium]